MAPVVSATMGEQIYIELAEMSVEGPLRLWMAENCHMCRQ
jgi:hypothetical protein